MKINIDIDVWKRGAEEGSYDIDTWYCGHLHHHGYLSFCFPWSPSSKDIYWECGAAGCCNNVWFSTGGYGESSFLLIWSDESVLWSNLAKCTTWSFLNDVTDFIIWTLQIDVLSFKTKNKKIIKNFFSYITNVTLIIFIFMLVKLAS